MRRVCYSVAMSLDGYIAGPQGQHDWILMDPEIDFQGLMSRFDTYLMGRRTFEMAGGGAMAGVRTIVVSRTLRAEDYPKVEVFGEDLEEKISQLRRQPGKDIWLFGGGSLFSSLLSLGLVDAVEVAIIPVLLGGGIPLLLPPAPQSTLRWVGHKVYQKTGIVFLEYEVDKLEQDLTDFATRYAAAWSSQDPERLASFYSEDGSLTVNQGQPAVGRPAIAAAAGQFMRAFPDMVVKMDSLTQDGRHAVFRWIWTGTHTGPGGTGRPVHMTGYEEWTLSPIGLIQESKGHYDEAEYQRQLSGEIGS